ncbi:MAG: GNAT family N-acetyltransferase [Erysipelotrichaceae bacterium]|nr:GNAT family N-acetyltransferase [Erysipelotrichaceae bacterium]
MIRNALDSEKQTIYRIWKEMFSFDDQGFTDYYFSTLYSAKDTLVYEVDQHIASTLQRRPHMMKLHDRFVACYFIVGVATLPPYQNKGYMKELMNSVLEEASYKCLITCLQAYDPNLYAQFGFETLYFRKKYQFHRNDFPRYKTDGISQMVSEEDLLHLYRQFTSRFNGYMVRDEQYYKNLQHQLEMEQGYLYTYYKDNELQGYMVCYIETNRLIIDEIVYLNGEALARMLSYACKQKPFISLIVSEHEHMEKLLPNAEVSTFGAMMVRINDEALFEECFGRKAKPLQEAFHDPNKPLYIHEVA